MAATSTIQLGAGSLYLQKLQIRAACTITNLWWAIQAAGVGSSTGSYSGLYSSSGTLLSGSADIGTQMTGSNLQSQALTTPQALSAGTFVWAALVVNLATTQPTLYKSGTISQAVNANLTPATARTTLQGSGHTTLPASVTPSGFTLTNNSFIWMAAN